MGGGNDSDDSFAEENPCANAPICLLCRRNPVTKHDAKAKAKATAIEKKQLKRAQSNQKKKQGKEKQSTVEPAQMSGEPKDGACSGK